MAGSALKRLMAEYKRIFYICLCFFVKFSVISFRDVQLLNSGRFGPIPVQSDRFGPIFGASLFGQVGTGSFRSPGHFVSIAFRPDFKDGSFRPNFRGSFRPTLFYIDF